TWCGRDSHARSCSSSRRRRRSRSISLVDGSEVTTRPSHCTRASRDRATRPPRAGSRDILGRRDVAGQGCDRILHRPRNHHDWSPRPLPVRTALMGTPLTQWTLRDWWTAWGGAALIVIPSFVFTLLSLAGGYGLLTLVSGGQCTLLMPSRSGGLGGIYLLFVVVGFVGLAVASLVKAVMGKDQ